ncbi:hypothetical protein QUC31_006292 [Theobroma cacao]
MATRSGKGDWPDDLLTEILLRLPVKAIIRFKCVAKTWYSLFESPSFASQHLSISKKNKRFLICHTDTSGNLVMRLFVDQTLVSYQDLFPQMPQHIGDEYPIICIYDGLLCLCNTKPNYITLWNPFTREFRLLPQCNENMPPQIETFGHVIGFGWDSFSNDYKVIYQRTYIDLEEDIGKTHHAVYRMSTDSWRVLEGKDVEAFEELAICNSDSNTCVNGVYYWVAFKILHYHKVLAFHFGNEVFQLIDWPTVPEPQYSNGQLCRLPDDRISLWISHFDENGKSNDVWVLNDEGQYWTKLLSIGPLLGVERMFGFFNKKINGSIKVFVEAISEQLLLYDLDTQEFKDLNIRLRQVWDCLEVYTYEESLVALSRDRIL